MRELEKACGNGVSIVAQVKKVGAVGLLASAWPALGCGGHMGE